MHFFYEKLYNHNQVADIKDSKTLKHLSDNTPNPHENDQSLLKADITLQELEYVVFKSINNISPGPDGFCNEYFKIL